MSEVNAVIRELEEQRLFGLTRAAQMAGRVAALEAELAAARATIDELQRKVDESVPVVAPAEMPDEDEPAPASD